MGLTLKTLDLTKPAQHIRMSALDEVIYNHNPFSKISLTLPFFNISHVHQHTSQSLKVKL